MKSDVHVLCSTELPRVSHLSRASARPHITRASVWKSELQPVVKTRGFEMLVFERNGESIVFRSSQPQTNKQTESKTTDRRTNTHFVFHFEIKRFPFTVCPKASRNCFGARLQGCKPTLVSQNAVHLFFCERKERGWHFFIWSVLEFMHPHRSGALISSLTT